MNQQRKPADRRATPRANDKPVSRASAKRTGLMIGGAIVGVALIAFVVASFSAGNDDGGEGLQETADVTVAGTPLPTLPETGADPAEGMVLPDLSGVSFDGTPVSISNDGRAKVLLVLAHW
jgi:hypothetical protein